MEPAPIFQTYETVVLLGWENKILCGDTLKVLKKMPSDFVDIVMTSPPYWGLRNYGDETCKVWDGDPKCEHEWVKSRIYFSSPRKGIGSEPWKMSCATKDELKKAKPNSVFCQKCGAWYGQLGLEPLPDMFVNHLIQIFTELKRVLKPTGSFFMNMGDSYACSRFGDQNKRPEGTQISHIPRKSLSMMPERVALAMVNGGWILRNKIIWHKKNPMPCSVKDRLTHTWEYVFHFVKEPRYYYDLDAIREPHKAETLKRERMARMCNPNGKNPGDIFRIATNGPSNIHSAVYPEKLCEKPIKAACPEIVCRKCGQPKRLVVKIRPNPDAFNVRVRDVKKGRIKSPDRKASEKEVRQYNEKRYSSRPRKLVISEGCKCNSGYRPGVVLDPFCGSGTTCLAAKNLGRNFIGIDINRKFCMMARKRLTR